MRDCVFRKYDIRGIVNQDLLISEVYNFGMALAYYFLKRKSSVKTVIIGMDGRTHSKPICDELTKALCESGLDVWFIGVCPTPVLYFALNTGLAEVGVMITASHNNKEYNGFKICFGKDLLSAVEIAVLRDLYKRKARIHAGRAGLVTKSCLSSYYIAWLLDAFSHLKESTITAVIDCGNGAAGAVIPELVNRMGWKNVSLLYEKIDGLFPNRSPDPTAFRALSDLSDMVRLNSSFFPKGVSADETVGIAFDGDADRMVAMTHTGAVVQGDILLAVFSNSLREKHPNAAVVFDGKCSQVVPHVLQSWNMLPHRAATGYAFVKQKMAEVEAVLGGEISCHFMFKDRYFGYSDGIYAMLRLFEIIHKNNTSLKTLVQQFPPSYKTNEIRIPCGEDRKDQIIKSLHTIFSQRPDVTICTLDGVRMETKYGWGLIRASNTEPVLSLCCESLTPDGFESIKKDFTEALLMTDTCGIMQDKAIFD